MPDPNIPQFTTAEYSQPAGDRCAACNQPITASYYRVNGKMACPSCTDQLRRQLPEDSHAAYVRALMLGGGAAVVGMIFYAGFTILTGFYIGYVALAVGWLVGKAMMLGSKGVGGRRYQIVAVLLTYAAVSIAAVPIAIYYHEKNKGEKPAIESQQPSSASNSSGTGDASGNPEQAQSQAPPKLSMGEAVAKLMLIGLASPFLELQDPVHGLIGLVILAVGIRIAWRITQGSRTADIQGPFDNSASVASSMR